MKQLTTRLLDRAKQMVYERDREGFTLIELIVVMAIISILVLLAAPQFIGYTKDAEVTAMQQDIKVLSDAALQAHIKTGDWPVSEVSHSLTVDEEEMLELKGLDKDIFDQYVKTLRRDISDYAIYTGSGTHEGEVFFIGNDKEGLTDRHGDTYYGLDKGDVSVTPGETAYSDEEIQDLINKGYIPIASAEELNSIRDTSTRTYGEGTKWKKDTDGGLDKKYVQVDNIDLSEYDGWNPIGTYDRNYNSLSFTGTYDGGNYVITGLEVKGYGNNFQGLFGSTAGATIRNVGLIDNKVTGSSFVGGLVGHARSSTTISNSYAKGSVEGIEMVGGLVGGSSMGEATEISNSYATGSVIGEDSVGGLVGEAFDGTMISNSYATGSVTGEDDTGGLVGLAYESTISNSYATGSVTGNKDVGGLVGFARSSTEISNSYATGPITGTGSWNNVGGLVGYAQAGTIENSYATGPVTGTDSFNYVGGLVGYASKSATISNSYATGSVKGEDFVGGLAGYASSSTISNSYWDTETTGQEESDGGEGKTTEEMKEKDTYSDWNFDDVWKIDEGNDYPKLR